MKAAKVSVLDQEEIPHSPSAVPTGLRCAFSLKKKGKIGTGTTQKTTNITIYHYAEQLEGDMFAIWTLNAQAVPFGSKEVISKKKLLELYHPEIEYYNDVAQPAIANYHGKLKRGDELRANKMFPEAANEYIDALKIEASCVHAYFGLGLTYLADKDEQKARAVFQQLIKLDSAFDEDHKHMFNQMGIQLRKSLMFDEAIHYYQRAVELSPDDEHLNFNLARTFYEKGDWRNCLDNLALCLELSQNNNEALKFSSFILRLYKDESLCRKYEKPSISKTLGKEASIAIARLQAAADTNSNDDTDLDSQFSRLIDEDVYEEKEILFTFGDNKE